jgi:hypothetical protein
MSNTNTGGPAFPDPQENWRGEKGMTLRDYFAAKAMQGMLASGNLPKSVQDEELAVVGYQVADAMLKVREA